MNAKKHLTVVAICVFSLACFFCRVFAWDDPTKLPPQNNVLPPVNVSSTNQTKTGNLNIGSGLEYWITKDGDSFALKNSSNVENFILGQNGFTGIALGSLTPDATAKLDLNGRIRIRGGSPGTGKVLTSDANGLASWTTATGGAMPAGTNGQTLRHDGTNWIGNNVLCNDGANIGIGTCSPSSKLEVSGQIKITGGGPGNNKILASDAGGLASWKTATDLGLALPAGSNNQTLRHDGTSWIANSLLINDGTNIGIGTAAPGAKLDVSGQIKISGGAPGAGKVLTSDAAGLASWQTSVASGGTIGGSGTTNYVAKFTSNTSIGNSQLFDNGSNIGIGTASPSVKLDVNGETRVSVLDIASGATSGWTDQLRWYAADRTTLNHLFFTDRGASDQLTLALNYSGGKNDILRIIGRIQITGGAPGTGKVLTSDASGVASWQTPSGGGNVKSDGATAIRKGWGTVMPASGMSYEYASVTINYGITFDTANPSVTLTDAGRDPTWLHLPSALSDCNNISPQAEPARVWRPNASSASGVVYSAFGHYACYTWIAVGAYSGADLAEYYKTADASIEAGDVVAIDKEHNLQVVKSLSSQNETTVGVISTKPGQVLGDENGNANDPNARLVALAGRVPVKVSLENGLIKRGDYLTASSVPGVAMRATGPCVTIGKALTDFDGTATTEMLAPGQTPTKNDFSLTKEEAALLQKGMGKVMTFLNIDYWEPEGYEASQNERIENQGKEIQMLKAKIEEITK
jgi:hypothetical protein